MLKKPHQSLEHEEESGLDGARNEGGSENNRKLEEKYEKKDNIKDDNVRMQRKELAWNSSAHTAELSYEQFRDGEKVAVVFYLLVVFFCVLALSPYAFFSLVQHTKSWTSMVNVQIVIQS